MPGLGDAWSRGCLLGGGLPGPGGSAPSGGLPGLGGVPALRGVCSQGGLPGPGKGGVGCAGLNLLSGTI